jgi:vacuolar-type H+-ATPase subunit I/STV1
MRYGKEKIKTGINKLIIIKTETMGNRKEQIANLENEIEQKQQALNQLREAEEREGLDQPDNLTPENIKEIEDFVRDINI